MIDSQNPGVSFELRRIPSEANEWDVTRAFAEVLHSEDVVPKKEDERPINFRVKLNKSKAGGVRSDGTGTLIIPSKTVGRRLELYLEDNPIKIHRKKIKVSKSFRPPPKDVAVTLQKTPYVSPDVEEEHEKIICELQDQLRIDAVQFGLFYRDAYPSNARSFSIEWPQKDDDIEAWLKFEYEHKLIRLKLGNSMIDKEVKTVAISFASIRKIAVGYDGRPYLCFDTLTPPVFEEEESYPTITEDRHQKLKRRIGSLHPGHARVAPYAPHLRIVLYHDPRKDPLQLFIDMCKTAKLGTDNIIVRFPANNPINVVRAGFFSDRRIRNLHLELARFPWPIAFQLESLLRNGVLHSQEIMDLIPKIKKLSNIGHDIIYIADFLRRFNEVLQVRSPIESPTECFQRVKREFVWLNSQYSAGAFPCYHITFTPTRMILEGPYATQSNRVIRRFQGYEDNFIRVDFRDEDRLQYRWDRNVDGTSFLQERVGGILKEGFALAGRKFEFLAYSSSALRQHAVWFVNPFSHPSKGWVSSQIIRDSLGNFTNLLRQPSKYAARIAQAFTATDPSVDIYRDEWCEVEDLMPENGKNLFTDGVGTISKALSDKIWATICATRRDHGENAIQPSAYQIRFLGYKGVVAVDEQLDKLPGKICMKLRRSMNKFEVHDDEVAPLEIAQAFGSPGTCYLNRPLVMILEDLGVRKEAFLELQDEAEAQARTIHDSISSFRDILQSHSLGQQYRVSYLLNQIERFGLDLRPGNHAPGMDTPFLRQLRQVAMGDVLRDIKHSARIPIPDSFLLVGIADEGPAYRNDPNYTGRDIYILPEGHIYACIQRPGDPEPTYLEGSCSISRSPVAHPGDVQRVRAIGKPPSDKLCLFANLKNVVVMPSVGDRSLASCLGGGDVDGDLFSVILHPSLLQKELEDAALYESVGTKTLDRDSTVEDICDFIVEYINSDLLGLLSDRLLVIADQSSDGIRDENCLWLAELCSQAVDYPKQGIPVDLDHDRLPRTLVRCKPDWHAAEVVSPRRTDYYESSRALGHMYRSITLEDPEPISETSGVFCDPFSNPISLAIHGRVRHFIGDAVLEDGNSPETTNIFKKYVDELTYICATHTLSTTPGIRLLEAEVVAGTILAKCSQKRWRKDRIYRMRFHSQTLVRNIQIELLGPSKEAAEQELVLGLQRAWACWNFSLYHANEFGASSFGLIALGIVFDCLDRL